MSRTTLYTNAVIHTGRTPQETFAHMTVRDGRITGLYARRPEAGYDRAVDLGGRHVYPCLIDAHIHLLLTVAVMAMGFSVCTVTESGVTPNTLHGVGERLHAYAAAQKPGAVVACSNYIQTVMDQRRMPSREELDAWGEGRPVVVYNIDGHSTAMSTAMLRLLGIDPEGHSGVLQGEDNERVQGRLTDVVGSLMTPAMLARGIAAFQNACAAYGISVVCALEGNGDSPRDLTTQLIARLARRFDVGVRLSLQYTDLDRVRSYRKWQRQPRVGGCGDWEMDGSVGSHSAAFDRPFADTGERSEPYFEQERVDALVREADAAGYQIAAHAIGDRAISRILHAYAALDSGRLHRIEHCEFPAPADLPALMSGRYALVMQPGYAWIDRRYLNTYRAALSPEMMAQARFGSLVHAGVCVCGSSDSPVQDLDPWLQMQGMVCFGPPQECVTPYEAFRCYTAHAARALGEDAERGTLEVGKAADFFTADEDLFSLDPARIVSFRPVRTWYAGRPYAPKKGTLAELAAMLLRRPRLI